MEKWSAIRSKWPQIARKKRGSKRNLIFWLFLLLVAVLIVVIYYAQTTRYYCGPTATHFDGKRFFNPDKPYNSNLFKLLKWKLTSNGKIWPNYVENMYQGKPAATVSDDELVATFVGHATVLLQTQGINILTDPIWSERASPVTWMGPKRIRDPGIAFEDLPPIDVILVSHNHYDHLDLRTLKKLWQRDKPRIIVPLGNDKIINKYDADIGVEAYDWGDSIVLSDSLRIHLLPTHHWSARHIYDRNKALWAAYVIETPGGTIYFPGDTGYGNGNYFRLAAEQFGPFRLALLPIGAYLPQWFMAYSHINPEEAVKAHFDLTAQHSMAIHFDTFALADDHFGQATAELQVALQHAALGTDNFYIPEVGQSWQVPITPEILQDVNF